MRKLLYCLLLGLAAQPLFAQDESILKAALFLSGAASEEEIPSDWIDRLESARTLRINNPHLRAGVLLTEYQVASILDYRLTHGDILSWEELALVDGFSRDAVEVLKPFLSLASDRLPGKADTVRLHATVLARSSLNSLGAKIKLNGERWRAGGAWRGEEGTVYAEWQTGRSRLLAGDFHTRWGQGVAVWTGFSMDNLSTVDAFVKRTTGLSPVGSYSPASVHRGLAYEYAGAHLRLAAFAGLGKDFGAHADYMWRHGQVGVTGLFTAGTYCIALDGKYNYKGTDWVGEAAYRNHSFAAVAAVRGKVSEAWRWAVQGRLIPSRYSGKKNGEYAFSAGMSHTMRNRHLLSLTADASLLPIPGTDSRRFQLRIYGIGQWQLSEEWLLDVRLTERYRNYEAARTDLRIDLKATGAHWTGVFRTEADHCDGWGFLGYLEGGYKSEKTATYLRMTGFWIDQWASRIYCYERDAPGTFSVPAYYGRGFSASLVGAYKWNIGRRFRLKFNIRAAWMARIGRKPSPCLNLQLQADW